MNSKDNYIDNTDGTVNDTVTGLMWEQNPGSWQGNWTDSITHCAELTTAMYTDWRLPNYYELLSIVDFGSPSPSINEIFFPNTASISYLSSTTYGGSGEHAYDIYFHSITSTLATKTHVGNYIRAVRDLQ